MNEYNQALKKYVPAVRESRTTVFCLHKCIAWPLFSPSCSGKIQQMQWGQKFMNKNTALMQSSYSWELTKRQGLNLAMEKVLIMSKTEQQRASKHTVSLSFFMSSVWLDKWMSVALGNMKILRCRESPALHFHYSYQDPIPGSMLYAKAIFLCPLSK